MSDPDPPDADEPRPDLVGSCPPRPAAAGHLVGRVEASTTRAASRGLGHETTLTFRLLGPDGQEPRDVQLQGYTIAGSVRDGDWVEVNERERGGRLDVLLVLNLTTGTEVRVLGRPSATGDPLLKVILIFAVVAILLLVLWTVLGLLGVVDDGWLFGVGGLFGGAPDGRLDPGSS